MNGNKNAGSHVCQFHISIHIIFVLSGHFHFLGKVFFIFVQGSLNFLVRLSSILGLSHVRMTCNILIKEYFMVRRERAGLNTPP